MSDPVIDAARRALVATRGHGNSTVCELESARQALKPIREKYRSLFDQATMDYGGSELPFPAGILAALREFAPLIYATEELPQ